MKNKLFFLFITSLVSLNNAKAMEKEVDQFQACPKGIITYIGNFLEGKDFVNFSSMSKKIRDSLEPLIIKDSQKNIKEKIEATSLNETNSLIKEWKNKKNIFCFLKKILPSFEGYESNPIDFKKAREKFKNYTKVMNILYAVGNNEVIEKLQKTFREIDIEWENTMKYKNLYEFTISNSELYKFHYRNMALIHFGARKSLSEWYREGKHPFAKDEEKSKKIAHTLNFPILLN